MPLALILDILLAVLLVVTIGYAVTLNKRLGTLRRDKAELQKLALSFGDATVRAEEGTAQLRATIDALQERIKTAEALREDLVFLVERGNGTADALEEMVRTARDDMGVVPRPAAAVPQPEPVAAETEAPARAPADAPARRSAPRADSADRPAPDRMSEAERELLKALRSAG